jgi:hypothetical protein
MLAFKFLLRNNLNYVSENVYFAKYNNAMNYVTAKTQGRIVQSLKCGTACSSVRT